MTARVRIVETGAVFDAPEGEDLLEVLQRNGYPIATSCGGVASCGLCRITVASGKQALNPIGAQELTHLGNVAKVIGTRLACQSKVCGDGEVVLSVPEVEDVEERKRRKSLKMRADRALRRGGPPGDPPAADAPRGAAPASEGIIEWRPRLVTPKREG
jgi:ferredoxin